MSTIGSVTLPGSIVWLDRFTAQGVSQVVRRTLGGGLNVQSFAVPNGSYITLQSGDDMGFANKTLVDDLFVLANDPGAVYTLVFGGVSKSVMFRHQDAPAFEAVPVLHRETHEVGDFFFIQLKLMEV